MENPFSLITQSFVNREASPNWLCASDLEEAAISPLTIYTTVLEYPTTQNHAFDNDILSVWCGREKNGEEEFIQDFATAAAPYEKGGSTAATTM